MPYVMRTVLAGRVREVKKMFTGRVHSQGVEPQRREKSESKTKAAQAAVNERKAEERLRWKLNANFLPGDYHIVLHYYDKAVTLEQAEADKKLFLRNLRKEYKKRDIPWKYVACTETKRMTNVHHHVIIAASDVGLIQTVWEKTLGERQGNVSLKPLDKRGNHGKLANYLMKETRSTVKRARAAGMRYKRFACSQGLIQPEPEYTVIQANGWNREPRERKGWLLLKDDNGDICRNGWHELTGWGWQEYFEIWTGADAPPGRKRQ